MAFFYVKSGFGTRTTGGGTTKQTGSMATLGATNVYAEVRDALADSAYLAGDIIVCSNVHLHDNGASSIVYAFNVGKPTTTISVDDANVDVFSFGAVETTTSTVRFDGKSVSWGVTYGTNSSVRAGANSAVTFRFCLLKLNTSVDTIGGTEDANYMELIDTEVACTSVSNGVIVRGGGVFKMFGGAFTGTAIANLITDNARDGGGSMYFQGVNLSNVTDFLIANHGAGQTFDDNLIMKVQRCRLDVSVGFIEEVLTNIGVELHVSNSSSVSSEAQYQFYYEDYFGTVEDQDKSGIVRTGGDTFDGGESVSFKITTNANVSNTTPFSFDIGSKFLELSNVSSDTVRLFFVIVDSATLTDTEFYAELIYPDGTTKQLYRYLTNLNANPLSDGTTHTTDSSSTWEDNSVALSGFNEYQMDLDTSGVPGADSAPFLRVYCGKASATIYLSMNIETVA